MTIGALPPEFNICLRAASPPPFDITRWFLFDGPYVPPANDAACRECVALVWLKETYRADVAAGGQRMDIRSFREQMVGDNAFTARVKSVARWTAGYSNI